jgi:rhamnogalacturonan acetylesterase
MRVIYRTISISLALTVLAMRPGAAQNAVRHVPTLYVVGDSTVKNGTTGQVGWGDRIGDYFDATKIDVVNAARGGRSSRTYLTERLWEGVLARLKPGDFVIMQFGHNDSSPLFTGTRPRGSIKGTGEQTEEGTVEITGEHEVVHTFGWYMRQYVADTRGKGASPIVCSLVPRNIWKDGAVVRDAYAAWARDAAVSSGAPFIDLNEIVARRYEEIGSERVSALFPSDHTHTNRDGAEMNAVAVVSGLKASKPCTLCPYLSDKAGDVTGGQRTRLSSRANCTVADHQPVESFQSSLLRLHSTMPLLWRYDVPSWNPQYSASMY